MKNSISLNDNNNNNNKLTIFMKQYNYIFPKNNLNDWLEEIIIEKIDDIYIKSFLGYKYYTPTNKKKNIPNKNKIYTTKDSKNIPNNNISNNNSMKLKGNPKNINKFKNLIFQRIFENGVLISGIEKNIQLITDKSQNFFINSSIKNNNDLNLNKNKKFFDVLNLDHQIDNFYIENNNNKNNLILNQNFLLENNKKLFDNEIIKTERQNDLNIFYENKYKNNNNNYIKNYNKINNTRNSILKRSNSCAMTRINTLNNIKIFNRNNISIDDLN